MIITTENKIISQNEVPLNSLILGDCLKILPLIKNKSIEIILTDLPYGQTQNLWDAVLPLDILFNEYNRIIKDNGIIILFGQGMFSAELMIANKKYYRYSLVWKKGNRATGFLNAKKMPMRNHEDILIFYKTLPAYNPIFEKGPPQHSIGKKSGKRKSNSNYSDFNYDNSREGSTLKYPKSILNFDKPHPAKHPTEKPVPLLEYLIKTYSNEGYTVLDNTAGILSTGVAAQNINRNYICIEKEKKYFTDGLKRFNKNKLF